MLQDLRQRFAMRLRGRMRSALLIALLLAALVWYTRWPSLRAGLVVLLVAQCAVAAALFIRSRQLGREGTAAGPEWFDGQIRFTQALGWFETVSRAAGFLMLGWGFWTATRSLALAAALGIGYPLVAYFGMERRNQARALHELRVEREALEHR